MLGGYMFNGIENEKFMARVGSENYSEAINIAQLSD